MTEKIRCALGLDLGGTFIKAVVMQENGTLQDELQVATPKTREVDATVAAISGVINKLHKNRRDNYYPYS